MHELDKTAAHSITWNPPEVLRELEASGCPTIIPDLVQEFISDTRQRLVRMRQAVAAANPTQFRREAHSIKGSAIQMGGEQVAALARALELEGATMPSWEMRDNIAHLEGEVETLCRAMTTFTAGR